MMVVVGMPAGADWIADNAKSFMNAKTAAKLRLHGGTRPRDVRQALSQYLPPETLFRAAADIDLGSSPASPASTKPQREDADADDDDGEPLTDAEIAANGREMLAPVRF